MKNDLTTDVKSYLRIRLGRVERVRAHRRRLPMWRKRVMPWGSPGAVWFPRRVRSRKRPH